ncbi:Hypothetical predicted protein [Lecanosticta acicola]|uniref:Uncharacterized protein n=1 Tax=Lecanosticta acicola TaxID=111012 RepID=A0AAI8YXS6_9PEZI|nr:Hypothetical predicted protein [Lecanosticta acicola]
MYQLFPHRPDSNSNESSQTLISPFVSCSPVLPELHHPSACRKEGIIDRPERDAVPRHPRKILSRPVLCYFTLDLLVAILAVYFIAFAIAAYANNGRTIVHRSASITSLLLQGARIGTTVFTILYAALVGRCLLAVAAWRLEKGCTFGLVEQLLSSRTVSNAVISPLRLMIFTWATPGLIILWSLSPIGSQAAQRVVYQASAISQAPSKFYYMDTPLSTTYGESTQDRYQYKASIAFQSALLIASVNGNDTQDIFGNIRIPLLESIPTAEGLRSKEWLALPSKETVLFSSHVGIPFNGTTNPSASTFSLQTSYMHANCSVRESPGEDLPPVFKDESSNQTFRANGYIGVETDASHNGNSSRPRRIVLSMSTWSIDNDYWYTTNLSCALTTTYIEAQINCNGTSCFVPAIRRSIEPYASPNITVLDGVNTTSPYAPSSPATIAGEFLANFINSTGNDTGEGAVPIAQYLIDPNAAFDLRTQYADYDLGFQKWVTIGSVPPETLSFRMTQLLNTYRMCALSTSGVNGGFGMPDYGAYRTVSAEGTIYTTRDTLNVSVPWLVMLLLSSFVMLAAGLVTATLNLTRRGPDILDSFTGVAQASRLIGIPPESSIDSASKRVRDLRRSTVILGDVKSQEEVGHVAIAVPRDDSPVGRILQTRKYR